MTPQITSKHKCWKVVQNSSKTSYYIKGRQEGRKEVQERKQKERKSDPVFLGDDE
jgi:hypothetical protein